MVHEEPQPVHAVAGNCGQWYGRERTHSVNDWSVCYDTAAHCSQREME